MKIERFEDIEAWQLLFVDLSTILKTMKEPR